jgi:hypothetical protein
MTRALVARWMRRWHKTIGLLAAVFFIYLALTGLFLNHSEALDPESTPVSAPWLMAWYGLKTAVPDNGFHLGGSLFAASDTAWAWAGKSLKPGHGTVVGAVVAGEQLWIATSSEIALFRADGKLIDRIERELLPAYPLRHLGVRDGRPTVDTPRGVFATTDGVTWVTAPPAQAWSHAQPLSDAEKAALAPLFAPSLSLERIVADLHSGRIFGRYGVLVTDALAASLLLLVASGAWMYFKSPRRTRRHHTGVRHDGAR